MIVLLTGLLAGFLDAVAATLLFLVRGNKNPALLFRYIASAVYGKTAFAGGGRMVLMGLAFHFLIAMSFVAAYFGLYPYMAWLGFCPLLAAFAYGAFMWVVMNLIVVPSSKAAPRPFSLGFAIVNWLILVVAIGLPAAYMARWYFGLR
ncbi:hypothetical protein [Puia sp.]|jgi:hypothetical protein|uniref:hypothetical protein n=1 Tax=Puia sp. TaxID=2045100 RepID=UPI002F42D8CF